MQKKERLRPRWFGVLKSFLKIFIRKPKIVFLGEQISEPSLILCNHNGAISPLKFELYFKYPFRFWGTYEMNSGLKSVYRYLKNVYFPQKKHIPKLLSTLIAIIAAPLLKLFYRGLNLISTYPDTRFRHTIQESLEAIKQNTNLVIFPEDSHDGYHDELTMFFAGFATFAEKCLQIGIDLPIFVSYYQKKTKTLVIDKPIKFSQLSDGKSRQEIADLMCDRSNELAHVD